MGLNNTNTDGNDGENAVTVDSTVRNEEMRESNRDAKIGLEIQPNIATTTPVSYWPTTVIGTLVSVFSIPIFVCRLLTPVCGGRPLLSRVQLPSCVPRAEFVGLSIKLFEDT